MDAKRDKETSQDHRFQEREGDSPIFRHHHDPHLVPLLLASSMTVSRDFFVAQNQGRGVDRLFCLLFRPLCEQWLRLDVIDYKEKCLFSSIYKHPKVVPVQVQKKKGGEKITKLVLVVENK